MKEMEMHNAQILLTVVGAFLAATFLVRVILNRIRRANLQQHIPEDWEFVAEPTWIRPALVAFGSVIPEAKSWRLFNSCQPQQSHAQLAAFDFSRRFTDADGDSVREYGSALVLRMPVNEDCTFSLRKKPSGILSWNQIGSQTEGPLDNYSPDPLDAVIPEDILNRLTDALPANSDIQRVAAAAGFLLLQVNARPFGRGMPQGFGQWVGRLWSVLVYRRSYADPESFGEMAETGRALTIGSLEHDDTEHPAADNATHSERS